MDGDPAVLVVLDTGYDAPASGSPAVRPARRDAGPDAVGPGDAPPDSTTDLRPKGGRPQNHGASSSSADRPPEARGTSSRFPTPAGTGRRLRGPETGCTPADRRATWLDHADELPLVEGTVIRLQVSRLPSGAEPKPVWPCGPRLAPPPPPSTSTAAGRRSCDGSTRRAHLQDDEAAPRVDRSSPLEPPGCRPVDLADHRGPHAAPARPLSYASYARKPNRSSCRPEPSSGSIAPTRNAVPAHSSSKWFAPLSLCVPGASTGEPGRPRRAPLLGPSGCWT